MRRDFEPLFRSATHEEVGTRARRGSGDHGPPPHAIPVPFSPPLGLPLTRLTIANRLFSMREMSATFKSRMQQLSLPLGPPRKRGGARPGAGRKKSPRSG